MDITAFRLKEKNILYEAMKKSNLFDMDKIELYHNKNEMLMIKDFTFEVFKSGSAVLSYINYYKKVVCITVLRPDYLIEREMILNM